MSPILLIREYIFAKNKFNMEKYFKIQFEFDHGKLEQTIIQKSYKGKGYCCFIDSNLLVESRRANNMRLYNVLNKSLVNSCDGSYIAYLVSIYYRKKLKEYSGPKFFNKFIYHPETQCIVGNTSTVFEKIKAKLNREGKGSDLHYVSLPFTDVDQFDYRAIAEQINEINPQYIWVSLGAPKQEIFMFQLLPHLNRGVMLGVGAALNYFSGEIKHIPSWAIKTHLIWFYRILTEPKKQINRVLKIMRYYPRVFLS